jgi:hypothetical protein
MWEGGLYMHCFWEIQGFLAESEFELVFVVVLRGEKSIPGID